MANYLGIVIEQSLANRSVLKDFRIEARRNVGSWEFLLVSISEPELEQHLQTLQEAMRPNEPWYAHYFAGNELLVVFRNALFRIGVDPSTWASAVEHGLALGIPREQLDFKPRTKTDALAFFGLLPELPAKS